MVKLVIIPLLQPRSILLYRDMIFYNLLSIALICCFNPNYPLINSAFFAKNNFTLDFIESDRSLSSRKEDIAFSKRNNRMGPYYMIIKILTV
jgi:hypothetical protein